MRNLPSVIMREHASVSARFTNVNRLDESWKPFLFSVSLITEFLVSFTMAFESVLLIKGTAVVPIALTAVDDIEG
jgi:hypothetical protein